MPASRGMLIATFIFSKFVLSLTIVHQETNRRLSSVRIGVEWMFGATGSGLKSRFKVLESKAAMRVKVSAVGKYWRSAVLLNNMYTMIGGANQVVESLQFSLESCLTLEEYMAL